MSVAYTTYYTLKDTNLENRALPTIILGCKIYFGLNIGGNTNRQLLYFQLNRSQKLWSSVSSSFGANYSLLIM